ncbi:MAG: alpha/beta hydrolase [Planctomycetota bacterium]
MKWMLRIATIYILVCAAIALFQRHLVFFPSDDYVGSPSDLGMEFEDVFLTTADGVRIHGWFVPRQDASHTMLMFHGNAGNITHRLVSIRELHRLGFNVLMIDYRGYGRSEGAPSEQGLYLDADVALKHLVEDREIVPETIIFYGRSLGGAVSVELATRHRPAAMVLECTFTRLADVAQLHYPLLPVGLMLTHRFESIDRIDKVNCPVLIFHGSDDGLIPAALGRRLYEAAAPPKAFHKTPGGHNDAGFTYSPQYGEVLIDFLKQHVSGDVVPR